EFLREAANEAAPEAEVPDTVRADADLDSQRRPWRVIATDPVSGASVHTDFLALDGRPVLRVPYVTGRADWHQAPIHITVFAEDGSVAGWLDGFGGLYRAWAQHVLGTSPDAPANVVVCESRQVGELLFDLPGDDL